MSHLLIIGNGFDLAHGLETGYQSFIEKLLKEECYKEHSKFLTGAIKDYNQLMRLREEILVDSSNSDKNRNLFNCFHNRLLHGIVNTIGTNWCDIETLYFNKLLGKNPKQLNEEFSLIKNKLEEYLLNEQKKWVNIKGYNYLFDKVARLPDTKILNFNYTSTVRNYLQDLRIDEGKVWHIHGELESLDNPIIFGYAATENDTQELLSRNDNEYLRNIKEFCYKRTSLYQSIQHYFEETAFRGDFIQATILGHSCSISDTLILKELFNNVRVNSIRFFYYEDYEGFLQSKINAARIIDDRSIFLEKVEVFDKCWRMPQKNDGEDEVEQFKKYVDRNYKR